jgi:hypothetical protein
VANSRNLIGTIQNEIQLRIKLPWHTEYCRLLFGLIIYGRSRPTPDVLTTDLHKLSIPVVPIFNKDCKGTIFFNQMYILHTANTHNIIRCMKDDYSIYYIAQPVEICKIEAGCVVFYTFTISAFSLIAFRLIHLIQRIIYIHTSPAKISIAAWVITTVFFHAIENLVTSPRRIF